jgi:ABC-type transport system substrate-binding protein
LDQNITIDIIPNFNSTVMFFLNMRYPPLHILEVRQAIDMALDKQEIIDFAAFGYATLPSMVPFAPGLAESNDDVMWTKAYTDTGLPTGTFLSLEDRIEDANDLLDSIPGMSDKPADPPAGWTRTWTSPDYPAAGDFELSFEGLYLSSPTYQRAAELIAEQMALIGIEIVPTVETGAFGPKVFSGWQVWNYETIIFGYPSSPDFDGVVKQWGMPVFGGNYDGSVVGWNNDPAAAPPKPEGARPQVYDTPYETPTAAQEDLWMDIYDQLVADAADVNADLRATRFETDSVQRLADVKQVQQDFADAMPIVCLYHPQSMSAFRTDSFEGWGNPEGIFLYGFMPGTTSVRTLMNVSPIE